jgi:hypothetical protein
MSKRVEAAFTRSSDEVRRAGELWYPSEADLIASIGGRYGLDRRTSVLVYAVLSPRVRLAQARDAFRDIVRAASFGQDLPTTAAYGRQAAKAWLLLHEPDSVYDALSGPKVEAFAANLLGNTERVTVDVWAARAVAAWSWRGDVHAYKEVEAAYQRAAARLCVAPSVVQATVWIDLRGTLASDLRHKTAWTDALA